MIDELAALLSGANNAADGPTVHFLTGEVTDATTWPPEIQTGASTTGVPTPVVGAYFPTVGDFVVVLTAGASRVCLGSVNVGAGCRLRRVANQSAVGGTTTTISWDTADQDLGDFWTSGTDITIPPNCAGVYAISARATGAGSWAVDSDLQVRTNGAAVSRIPIRTAAARITASATRYLSDGDVIDVIVNSTGATQNMTADVVVARVA